MKKYVLAIDQGTTSTRAILFDHDQRVVASAAKDIANYFPHNGWVEMDADEVWLSVLAAISELFQKSHINPEEVETIGITNQRETTVIWNKKTGLPVYNAIVWQSRQTEEIVEHYRAEAGDDFVKTRTGLIFDPYFSASKIRFILDRIDTDTKDLLFGTIDSWLVYKLTGGEVHVSDVTNASRTLLFNIHTLDWDEDLLSLFAIPRAMLPQIVDTSGFIGMVKPYHFFNMAVPISAIVGDQQAALFGQSCLKEGDIKNTYGTGGFLLINTGDKMILSKNGLLSTVAWKIKDQVRYALEGSIFVSGSLMQWLRDGLHLFSNVSETEAIAKSIESSKGVVIVPAFTGLGAPYWDAKARGMILNLDRGTDYRHLIRAGLEAMAYQSKDLIDIMAADSGHTINSLKVDGGASRNNFLLQFQSDILGIPVIRNRQAESTALGAARLAGLATGFYTMDDFTNDQSEIFEPQMSKEEAEQLYDNWVKAVGVCQRYK